MRVEFFCHQLGYNLEGEFIHQRTDGLLKIDTKEGSFLVGTESVNRVVSKMTIQGDEDYMKRLMYDECYRILPFEYIHNKFGFFRNELSAAIMNNAIEGLPEIKRLEGKDITLILDISI